MKYTIIINQKVLADSTLDTVDCSILDWLTTICRSTNERIVEKRIDGMTWIDYKTLIKDMPVLRIKSPTSIGPRLKKIEKNGYIKCKTIIDKETGYRKMYVSLESKIDDLSIEKQPLIISTIRPNRETHQGPNRETHPIIILNNNHSTSDTDMCISDKSMVEDTFDRFWSSYPKKENKAKAKEKWFKKNFAPQIDIILSFIEEAKKTDRWKKGYVKDPVTFLNNQSWNDDLSGYYDNPSARVGVYKDKKENDYMKNVTKVKN